MNETMRTSTVSALTIPPRPSHESFFNDMSCFSPGPMSLVSSFLQSPNYYDCSYSQLLAGAIASSPLAKQTLLSDHNSEEGCERNMGYKQNRPMSLVLAQSSPLFMIPPGLSPSGLLNSPGFLSPLQSPFGMSHQQALAHVTAQAALSQSYRQMQAEDQCSSQASVEMLGRELSTEPKVPSLQLKVEPLQNRLDNEPSDKKDMKFEVPEVSQSENKPSYMALDKPASDGYNWRKYGQKKVKASECPRSYYKCTHPKCPVKKKVERAVDGHITELTYSGRHNHELPQPSKQRKDVPALDCTDSSNDKLDIRMHEWTVMTSLDGSSPSRSDQVSIQMASELLMTKECDETKIIAIDEGYDEPNAKRTKAAVETLAPSHGTVVESKIVLQTRSEVDFLDDGYKWRKYGQKVVKGNQNPRSYYRCTFTGCNVRKQVERASADPKAVITTYEGKHNHDIPTVRNRNSQR